MKPASLCAWIQDFGAPHLYILCATWLSQSQREREEEENFVAACVKLFKVYRFLVGTEKKITLKSDWLD